MAFGATSGVIRRLTLAILAFNTSLVPAVSAVVLVHFLAMLSAKLILLQPLVSGWVPRTQVIVAFLFDYVELVHIAIVA